jgi:hypothetical protein
LPLASSYSQSTDIVGNEVFPRWADTNTIERQAASEVNVNASQKTERQEEPNLVSKTTSAKDPFLKPNTEHSFSNDAFGVN